MTSKPIDFSQVFSQLDTDIPAKRDPYEYDDLDLARDFKGKAVHRGTVDVSLEDRALTPGLDDIVVPTEAGGKHFDLVFKGQRATDYREAVRAPLAARRTEMLQAKDASELTEEDFAVADAATTTIIVEGFWKKRWWKDRKGAWQNRFELHVAKFHYRADGSDAFIEKGRIPEMA